MSKESTPPPSRGSDAADAIAAVLADQQERATRRGQPQKRPPDRGPLLAVSAVALAVCGVWFWLAPPAVLMPPPLPEPSPAQVAAGLRLDTFAAAASVRDWAARNGGRLPPDLVTAWPRAAGGDLILEHLPGGAFRIIGRRGDAEIRYHSSEPMERLLDGARPALEAPRP